MTIFITLFILSIFVLAAWLLHRFMPTESVPKEIAKVITMPLSPYAKEYATLRDRIKHASTKSELSVLEFQALEFISAFGENVRDMYDDLVQELNIRSHVLFSNSLIKAR